MPLPPDRMRVAWLPPTQPGSVLTLASPPLAPKWLPPGPIDYVLAIGPDHLPRWVPPPSGGGGGGDMSNPMTGIADLIVGGVSGTPTRLAVGAPGTVLTAASGAVQWLPPAPGFSNPMTTLGDLIVAAAAGAPSRLPVGAEGTVLTIASGVPTWAALPGETFAELWRFDSTIQSGPPLGLGRFMLDSATTPTTVTISATTDTSIDATPMLQRIQVGDTLYVQHKQDSTKFWRFQVTSVPVFSGSPVVAVLGVTLLGTQGGAIINNAPILVALTTGSGGASSGMANPMTSVGDLITGGAAGAASRLGVGTAGQVLTVASGVPSWRTPLADPLVGAWTWTDALIASPPISTGQLGRNAAAGVGLDAATKQYIASSGSFTHTAGPTTTAIVISSHAGSGNYRITAATYGGMALTSAGSHINGTAACVSTWYLLNPPLGTQTVSISFNGDGYVLVRSLTGVASFGALASATSGGNPLTTTIASAAGRFVIDAATKQNAGTTHTMTPGAGQTVHFQDGGVETGPAVLGSIKAGAASVTMTWTDSPGGGLWGAQQLLEVIPLVSTGLPPSMIVVSTTAADGSNHAFALGALKPGDSLIVQSYADAAKTFRVDVTGNAVVTGATVQIPVTPRSAAWGAYPANGDLVALTLDLGAGGFNPLTTSGDIIVGLSGGALGRLGIGTAGQVLTVGSGTPVWTTPFTNPMTGVGDLIRGGTAGAATRLAPGSNGQWLTLTGGIPAWAALPAPTLAATQIGYGSAGGVLTGEAALAWITASRVIQLTRSLAVPASSPADIAQVYVDRNGGTAGNAGLFVRDERGAIYRMASWGAGAAEYGFHVDTHDGGLGFSPNSGYAYVGSGTSDPFALLVAATIVAFVDTAGNLMVGPGTAAFGTNAARSLGLAMGTAPTTSPADLVQLTAVDVAGAGTAGLALRDESGYVQRFGQGGHFFPKTSPAPATPPTGFVVAYAKSDGRLYQKDEAGIENAFGFADSMPAVRNLAGTFTAAASTIALTADYVWLRDPVAKTTLLRAALNATLNLTTAGPAVNGRDQAGNLGPNAWVYIYAIWNGTTLGLIASASTPATGPTLPSGYTHWAFLTALRVGGTANQWLNSGRVLGRTVYLETSVGVLVNGNATAETAISLAAAVPIASVAPRWFAVMVALYQDTTVNVARGMQLRLTAGGGTFYQIILTTQVANINMRLDIPIFVPNVAQNVYYLWDAATGTRNASLFITGYDVLNGDG